MANVSLVGSAATRTDNTSTYTELSISGRANIDRDIVVVESPIENLDDFWNAIESFNKKDIKKLIFSKQINLRSEDILEQIFVTIIQTKKIKLLDFLCDKLKDNFDPTITKAINEYLSIPIAFYAIAKNISHDNISTIKKLMKALHKYGMQPICSIDIPDIRYECERYENLQSDEKLLDKVVRMFTSEKQPHLIKMFLP